MTRPCNQKKMAVVVIGMFLCSLITIYPAQTTVFAEEHIGEVSSPPADAPPADTGNENPPTESTPPSGTGESTPSGDINSGNADVGSLPPPESPDVNNPSENNQPASSTGEPAVGVSSASSTEESARGTTSVPENGIAGASSTAGNPGIPGNSGNEGNSGGNGNGSAEIDTGDARAFANLLNVLNLNIIDSEGFTSFLNLVESFGGDVDFRNYNFPLERCLMGRCSQNGGLTATNNNTSTLTNNVNVNAGTGENQITGTNRSAVIRTGNSAAAANVVNIVNSNIIRSNYFLVTLNKFGDWAGDLVLPAQSLFSNLFSGQGGAQRNGTGQIGASSHPPYGFPPPFPSNCNPTITNQSTATITNNGNTSAATGNNVIEGATSSAITTGNANAISNVATLANQNIVNQDSIYILIRVVGRWSGNVLSTPPGVLWQETPEGILLYTDGSGAGIPNVQS